MSSNEFYARLPKLRHFADITNPRNFTPVPDDWYAAVTDIRGSTAAIEAGRYKDVNMLGACSIVSVLNVAREIDIPFVFGGDGATLLIPPVLLEPARQALVATQQLAKQSFDMDLRVGIVPVAKLRDRYPVEIAKLEISENYAQAIVRGGGITYATDLIKQPETAPLYQIVLGDALPEGDFSGLECRWQDIPSRHGEILSLIVLATAENDMETDSIYREAIARIQGIYGGDRDLHPVANDDLHLAFHKKQLWGETRVLARSRQWLGRQFYLWKLRLLNLLGFVLMKLQVRVGEMDWGKYKDVLVSTTDYKKFDDILRMVIAGTAVQREELHAYLESQFQAGKLVYGLHTSDRALMTCLVFERNGRQVHFIDGADGGYALAAKAMKKRLARGV